MTLEPSLHKNLLIRILKDIYTDPTLGLFLGFNGRTAALSFYDLPRFSVDLDFDLLDATKGDFVFAKIQEKISDYGEIKDMRKKRFSYFFLLSYANKTLGAYNI